MDNNNQEMNPPPKIDPSPEALEFLEKASNLEEIVQSLSPLPSSFSPPSFTPSLEDVELRGRVRELEEALQRLTVTARDAELRAERAETLLATKLVDEVRKDAENSELTRVIDGLKKELAEAEKIVKDTRKERHDLAQTNYGLHEDNIVLVSKMKEGNEAKRVLTEEIESLKQDMAEMRRLKRAVTEENGLLRHQLAEMGMNSDRVAKWLHENQDGDEKKRKKPAHKGNSKKRHSGLSSPAVISVKTLDPAMSALTEEERYGNEQEVVCEGCVWKKVNGEWRVTVGEKDEGTNEEDTNVEKSDEDKMIEEMIKEHKRRIDCGEIDF